MKLLLEKFAPTPDSSFSVSVQHLPYHDPFLHFHDDYELVAVLNARGTRFIGDHVGEFIGNEIVLVAPQVPHCWHIADNMNGERPVALVVHFSEGFMGGAFFKTPEFLSFYTLIKQAERGVLLRDNSIDPIVIKMKKLPAQKGLKSLLTLLGVFENLSAQPKHQLLASAAYTPKTDNSDYHRINKIYEFVSHNFSKSINLKDVADLIHLSPSAFCRYFRRTTQRTFFDYLKEIKIGHASKMLRESNKSIAEICYESGYNNVANFNRQFKQLKSYTPSTYRKIYKTDKVL